MYRKVTSLSKQSAIYGLGTFLNQGLNFFLIPLYTRFLTREEYGISVSVTAILGVLSIVLTLSLESAIARFYYDFDTEEERRAYFGSMWSFLMVFGLAITLILNATGNRLFDWIFRDVPFDPYGRLALWSTYVGVTGVIPIVMFRVREQARTFVAFSVSQFLLRIVLNIVTVVFLHQGVTGIFVSMLISNLVYAVPFTWITWKGMRLTFPGPPAGAATATEGGRQIRKEGGRQIRKEGNPLAQLRASLAYSMPFVPHRLSNWVLNVSDRILLQNFVSLGDLGLYGLGYRFGLMLAAVFDAINMAWAPFYFKTAKETGGREALARLVTYYVFVVSFFTLGTVLLSREILFLVADTKFWPAYRVVPPVAFAYGLHGLYLAMVTGQSYVKKTARIPLYTGISAAVNVGLNLLLIPRYGIMAAAWSTFIAYFLRAILISVDSIRVFPIPYEYRRLGWGIGIGLALSAGWFIDVGSLWANLAVKAGLLCAYPVVIRFSGLLRPDEIAGLQLLTRRVGARFSRMLGRSHD